MQVHDEGVGVHPGEQQYLFEPFFTGFDTLHHSSGEYQFCKRGIGLGLCLVKTFVELHGGRVEVPASPGSWLDIRVSSCPARRARPEATATERPGRARAVEGAARATALTAGTVVKIIGVTEGSSVEAAVSAGPAPDPVTSWARL